MPTKEHKFELGTRVKLPDLDRAGRIVEVMFQEFSTVPHYKVITGAKYDSGYVAHVIPEPSVIEELGESERE